MILGLGEELSYAGPSVGRARVGIKCPTLGETARRGDNPKNGWGVIQGWPGYVRHWHTFWTLRRTENSRVTFQGAVTFDDLSRLLDNVAVSARFVARCSNDSRRFPGSLRSRSESTPQLPTKQMAARTQLQTPAAPRAVVRPSEVRSAVTHQMTVAQLSDRLTTFANTERPIEFPVDKVAARGAGMYS